MLSGRRSRGWLAGEWPGRPPFLAKRPSRSHSSRSVLNVAPTGTINALWQLHPGNDRHEFFRAAQDKWSAKYKGNDDAVAALLERVELQGRSSTDGRRLMPSFLGATGRSLKEPVADAAGSAPISSTTGTASTDNTDVEVVLSVSGARKPLVLLCEALDVNPSSFLTEDVVGKASVVATLTTVAERFALHRSEKRHYESSRLFQATSRPLPNISRVLCSAGAWTAACST